MPPAQTQDLAKSEAKAPEAPHRPEVADDAWSNASSDYGEPLGMREKIEWRYEQMMKWIGANRTLVDFIAYFFFLLVFTIVATEAHSGEDLIEQVPFPVPLRAAFAAACSPPHLAACPINHGGSSLSRVANFLVDIRRIGQSEMLSQSKSSGKTHHTSERTSMTSMLLATFGTT